jgi:hypothetical protein
MTLMSFVPKIMVVQSRPENRDISPFFNFKPASYINDVSTPCSIVRLGKLIVTELGKKFPGFMEPEN